MLAKAIRYRMTVILLLASGSIALAGEGGGIDPSWLAKARAGIKGACEKYETLSPRLEGEYKSRAKKAGDSGSDRRFRPNTTQERIIRLGDNALRERIRTYDTAPNQPSIQLECDNSDYHFNLGKSKLEASYALVDYARGKRKHPLARQGGLDLGAFSKLQDALAALENEDKFALRALRFDDARGLLRIDFADARVTPPMQEQLYVDPNRDWRAVERRLETSSLVATERWAYGLAVGGLEFPNELKNLTIYKVDKAPPNLEITDQLIFLKITEKTPEDFRLSGVRSLSCA